MAGFASFIGGVGQEAGKLGEAERQRTYQAHQNDLTRWQRQHESLSDALERAAALHEGPEGDALRDLQLEVQGLDPSKDVQPYVARYTKRRQEANQVAAQKAAQTAAAQRTAASQAPPQPQGVPQPYAAAMPTPIPNAQPNAASAIQPIPNAPANPPSLAQMIGLGSASQPGTSPVQPQAQGGSNSPTAAFRTPQPNALGNADTGSGAPIAPISAAESAPADSPIPTLTANTGASSVAPIVDLDKLLGPALESFGTHGYISPTLKSAIEKQMGTQAGVEQTYRTGQVGLELNKQKLKLIQPLIEDMRANPDNMLQDLMTMETLTSGANGNALALGPILSSMQQQTIPGQETVGSLETREPGFLASQGYDVSKLDPNAPVRVQINKITHRPVSVELSSVSQQSKQGAEGTFNYNPKTGKYEPVAGITPIGMAPSTSIVDIPGQLPQKTVRTKTPPAPTVTAAPRTAVPKKTSGNITAPGGAADHSVIAQNYNDWIAGKAQLTEKEQTAARDYAGKHGLPTPDMLSPSGQKAIANLQPILDEIQHAKQLLKDKGLDTMDETQSKLELGKAYGKYAYFKVDDPLAKAISDLSFDSLRSVGQALQGTGSRAYPIFVRGLEHTPVIGLNSDSGKLMYDKLDGMERRVQEALDAARTETKSGVVPPVSKSTQSAPSVVKWGRDAQGNPVRLAQ